MTDGSAARTRFRCLFNNGAAVTSWEELFPYSAGPLTGEGGWIVDASADRPVDIAAAGEATSTVAAAVAGNVQLAALTGVDWSAPFRIDLDVFVTADESSLDEVEWIIGEPGVTDWWRLVLLGGSSVLTYDNSDSVNHNAMVSIADDDVNTTSFRWNGSTFSVDFNGSEVLTAEGVGASMPTAKQLILRITTSTPANFVDRIRVTQPPAT